MRGDGHKTTLALPSGELARYYRPLASQVPDNLDAQRDVRNGEHRAQEQDVASRDLPASSGVADGVPLLLLLVGGCMGGCAWLSALSSLPARECEVR